MKNIRFRFALLVWLVAELVLQIHGIDFWQEHGGTLGALWSVAIGIIAVWSWLHDSAKFRWVVGGLTSLLLLIGPLLQVGAPVVAQIEQRHTQQSSIPERIELLRNAEAQQVATLKTYERNSEKFRGWKDGADSARGELAATRGDLLDLLTNPPAARAAWLSWVVIIIQMVALILLQVAAVAALGVIRCCKSALQPATQIATAVATQRNVQQLAETTCNTDKLAGLAEKITGGHYGDAPVVRRIIAEEGLRHSAIQRVFERLIEGGMLRREGRGVRLVE